jgi:hypothetical protein
MDINNNGINVTGFLKKSVNIDPYIEIRSKNL